MIAWVDMVINQAGIKSFFDGGLFLGDNMEDTDFHGPVSAVFHNSDGSHIKARLFDSHWHWSSRALEPTLLPIPPEEYSCYSVFLALLSQKARRERDRIPK